YSPLRRRMPLMIGTWKPRMAALAGDVADEVKIGGSANPDLVRLMREWIGNDDVGIVVGAVTVVDEDGAAARERARAEAARYRGADATHGASRTRRRVRADVVCTRPAGRVARPRARPPTRAAGSPGRGGARVVERRPPVGAARAGAIPRRHGKHAARPARSLAERPLFRALDRTWRARRRVRAVRAPPCRARRHARRRD